MKNDGRMLHMFADQFTSVLMPNRQSLRKETARARYKPGHGAVVAAIAMFLFAQQAYCGPDDFIASGHVSGRMGQLQAGFVGMDLQFAMGPELPPGPMGPPERDWFLELDDVTEANVGQTWIIDQLSPNFAIFESYLTDGLQENDFLWTRGTPNEPSLAISELGPSLYNAIHGGPNPPPGEVADLHGYDIAEVHLTLEAMSYVDGVVVLPGFPPFYGYDLTVRYDFYGSAVPAPPTLVLLGVAAAYRRRRRS